MAQLVERDLAKVEATGSNPVTRSIFRRAVMKYLLIASVFFFFNSLLLSESCEYSKWGKGDEIGNANLISNKSVLNAAKLIKTGKVYSLV